MSDWNDSNEWKRLAESDDEPPHIGDPTEDLDTGDDEEDEEDDDDDDDDEDEN